MERASPDYQIRPFWESNMKHRQTGPVIQGQAGEATGQPLAHGNECGLDEGRHSSIYQVPSLQPPNQATLL